MSDERPRSVKGEVLPPVHNRVEDEPAERKTGEMVNIDLPPGGLIRTAFFTAVEYRMKNKAADAYNQCLTTLLETRSLLDDLNYADFESERVFRFPAPPRRRIAR